MVIFGRNKPKELSITKKKQLRLQILFIWMRLKFNMELEVTVLERNAVYEKPLNLEAGHKLYLRNY